MSGFVDSLLGIDAWGVWFPGIIFLLSQNLLSILICNSPLIGRLDLMSAALLFGAAFAVGSTLQLIGTLLNRKINNKVVKFIVKAIKGVFWLDFLQNSRTETLCFSKEVEVTAHKNIWQKLAPDYDDGVSVINHYEAILTKASPTAFKRTVELMNSISIQRTFAVALTILVIESFILYFNAPELAKMVEMRFGLALVVDSHYAPRLFAFGLSAYVLSCGLYALSCWLWNFRSRFICRNVACFDDEVWAALEQTEN